MSWLDQLNADPLPWLLEESNPDVRYCSLCDLLDRPADEPELSAARRAAYQSGPIPAILDHMNPEGWWNVPEAGYLPKYISTVWSLILLAQLGASIQEDERVGRACSYFLDHALAKGGQIGSSTAPSSTVDCLQGNMCWALLRLGYDDPRLELAYEWMARTLTGEGMAPMEDKHAERRYYAGKCGPRFACGANNKLPCAWGGAKVMLAFGVWPKERRTPLIERAIEKGWEFFLETDPAQALYPSGWAEKPSGNWWKFGFPVFYITDILQIAEAAAALGCARDPRLDKTLALIRSKQDSQGRWPLEYDYTGKTWVDFGLKKQPNKWVTLRALRVLKAVA